MRDQVCKVCQTEYLEVRIGSIRKHITTEAMKTLVFSLVIPRFDYWNSLLAGAPQKHLAKLEGIMNCAARLVCRVSKHEYISPSLADVHSSCWFALASCVSQIRIQDCYFLHCYLRFYASKSYRSSIAHSLPVSPLICWFTHRPRCNQTQEIPGESAFSSTGPVIC